MKVYFDTNIILDFLLARPASGLEAAQLITLAETKSIEAFAAGNTFVLAFFHMRKGGYDANDAKHTLALLCRSISCVDFGNDALDKALSTNEPVDLEDAYQIQLALQSKADVFLTNDRKLLKLNKLKMQSPKEFLLNFKYS